ncbi:MAG: porin family protein [Tannerella sp.]|nr:porin family protein [Tannerella sp.]
MKKKNFLLLAFTVTVMCVGQVSAQEKGYGAVGANIVGGFGGGYTNLGVGAELQLNFLHPLRIEGSVTPFIRNRNISMLDASLNLHWLAFLTDRFCIYPLAGAGMHRVSLLTPDAKYGGLETDEEIKSLSEWKVCGNFGGGLDFYLTDVVILNFEAQYKYLKYVKDASRINVSAGISYLF